MITRFLKQFLLLSQNHRNYKLTSFVNEFIPEEDEQSLLRESSENSRQNHYKANTVRNNKMSEGWNRNENSQSCNTIKQRKHLRWENRKVFSTWQPLPLMKWTTENKDSWTMKSCTKLYKNKVKTITNIKITAMDWLFMPSPHHLYTEILTSSMLVLGERAFGRCGQSPHE